MSISATSPKSFLVKLCYFLFDICASMKLAVLVLLSLGVALAVGTFVETLHGATAAKQVIYHSFWFNCLLGLLGINVACSAFSRFPWQLKHVGFLTTHAGILIILVGSWLTNVFMIQGEIALQEGERGDQISLNQPLIQLTNQQSGQIAILPLRTTPFRWDGRRTIPVNGMGDLQASLLSYYPNARFIERAISKPGGKPTLFIKIFNEFVHADGWLVEGDSERGELNLGPAVIRFAARPLKVGPTQEQKNATGGRGILTVEYRGKEIKVSVDDALEKEITITDSPLSIRVLRVLNHAVVDSKNQLQDNPGAPVNPACEFIIRGNRIEEKRIAFALFPDFQSMHKQRTPQIEANVKFELPTSGTDSSQSALLSPNELRIFRDAEGLFYQVKKRNEISSAKPLEVNKEIETGWMNLKFKVETYYPEAGIQASYEARKMPSPGKNPIPAALIEFEKNNEIMRVWLTIGSQEVFSLEGVPYTIIYGSQSYPLGFSLILKDFQIEYYKGSTQPAAFQSQVRLEDFSRGDVRNVLISMNEPLSHAGFKIYQAGYHLSEDGGPDTSIFAVGRDIGVPVKYLGSIIMVSGILTMFFVKKFSSIKPLFTEKSQ